MPENDDNNTLTNDGVLTEDVIHRHALREAIIILSMWATALIYTCSFCYLYGYETHASAPSASGPAVGTWFGTLPSFNRDPVSLTTPLGLGIPDWVFYGVVLPWIACVVATFWFCLFVFHDADLKSEEERSAVDSGEPHHG